MQRKRTLGLLVVLTLAGILAASSQTAYAEENANIEEMVKNARTPADHQALAAHYDALAADAESRAASHRTMANSYRGIPIPKGGGTTAMVQHCENLAKSFDSQAREYKAMAAAHRQMAK